METQARGLRSVTVDDVFMGNGASELTLMCMEALLSKDDEVTSARAWRESWQDLDRRDAQPADVQAAELGS